MNSQIDISERVSAAFAGAGLPYWLRQQRGAERRANTWREKAKWHRDPKWCLAMARGAELDASRCFKRWRAANPQAPHPFMPGGEFFLQEAN